MVLAGYAAAGVALMINSTLALRAGTHAALLDVVAIYWPLGTSVVAVAGLRHAFLMPAELRANWLFQITETQGRQQWMSAVERFLIGGLIVPIHAVAFLLATIAFGFPFRAADWNSASAAGVVGL